MEPKGPLCCLCELPPSCCHNSAPLWGGSAPPFPVHPTGLFLFEKDQLNHLPTAFPPPPPKAFTHSWLQDKILFFSPSSFLPVLSIENSSSSAGNYHREKSHLFWAIHLRFHTGPVFNTPEWPSSGQPAPSSCSFSMPPAPTHTPSVLTLILSMISFLALLEMDHSTQTVLIRRIALPCLGPLGLPTLQCKHLLQGFNLDI